jgi:hypothetical protein
MFLFSSSGAFPVFVVVVVPPVTVITVKSYTHLKKVWVIAIVSQT